MAGPIEQAVFEVTLPGVAEPADELGIWQPGPALAPAPFATPAAAAAEQASVWRVILPADPRLAHAAVAARVARLDRAERALPVASRRLQRFVQGSLAQGPVAFSAAVGVGAPDRRPERDLATWVSAAGPQLSFGPLPELPADWPEVAERALAFFDRVRGALMCFAWIESRSGDRRLGLTTVSWTGKLTTVWGTSREPADAGQHARNVELAVRTRLAWLRMAVLVASASVQLGLLLPTAPLLAIPAAWRFFRQMLELARAQADLGVA